MKRLFIFAFVSALLLVLSQSARADSYKIDPDHATALFASQHFGAGYVWGRFDKVSGAFTLDDSDPTKDTFQISIDVASLDTNVAARDTHLKSADFFNAAQYTTIDFKSTSVKKIGDKALEVTGDLTVHGVTKSIKINVALTGTNNDPQGKTRSGLETLFTLKRSDYGMDKLPTVAGDEIRLISDVEGIKN
jgi:polyisoprenoid-binding protein YceI